MNANESFEQAAECFYKATGMLMPGKDIGAGAGWSEENEEERQKLFKVWCAAIDYMRSTPTPTTENNGGDKGLRSAIEIFIMVHHEDKKGLYADGIKYCQKLFFDVLMANPASPTKADKV